MIVAASKLRTESERVARYADMFSAMGTEPRLRIMQLLLSAHPEGLVVGEIQDELDIPSSTLSHHLDKLKNEDLVKVQREGTFPALHRQHRSAAGSCCTFSTPNAAPATRRVKPQRSHSTLQIGEHVMPDATVDIDIKEVVKEKYGQAALRVTQSGGSSCCGAAPASACGSCLRSHHLEPLRRGAGRSDSRGRAAGFARLRQSHRAGAIEPRRNRARSGFGRRH